MKKITFIISTLLGGGAERVISEISAKLCDDYDVSIVLLLNGHERVYQIDDRIKIVELPKFTNKITKLLGIPYHLRKIMRSEKSDIYISFCTIENVMSLIANKFARKKLFIAERNAPMAEKKGRMLKILRKLLYNSADGIIFQTDYAKKYYSLKIQKKGIVIPNPIKSSLPYRVENNEKSICAVGRLNKQKNYPLLINAFSLFVKKNENYILKIYGKGEEEENLTNLIIKLGLSNQVILEGFKENVHDEIRKSTIFVMSSDYEGMPNALMEAMAIGLPCISTDCPSGGPRDLISNNENGYLIPVNDMNSLVDKLDFLANNANVRNSIGNEAEKVRDKYDIDSVVMMWKELIKSNI